MYMKTIIKNIYIYKKHMKNQDFIGRFKNATFKF